MKKFIIKTIVLLAILLVISVGIEVALLFLPNMYSYKHQYIQKHKDDIRVLFMGNSHILNNIIPDTIGYGVFNNAISGRTPFYDKELVKQYVPVLSHLETLVIPLDCSRFYFGREIEKDESRSTIDKGISTAKCMYYKYMDVKDDWWYWSELLNSKLNFMARFAMSEKEAIESDSLGYQMLKVSEKKNNWQTTAIFKDVDQTKIINKEEYDQLYLYYAEMARITKDNNVRLVLLGTPIYKVFKNGMKDVILTDRITFVAKLKSKFANVDFYDYTNDDSFVSDDFYNTDHLTELGAAKFSKKIKDILFSNILSDRVIGK